MKQIEDLLNTISNKTLLVVFPHPDDETVMAGGLVQRVQRLGWKVVVLYLTKGERGQVHIHGKGRSIREIRSTEFKRALAALKVDTFLLWDMGDGELRHRSSWQTQLAGFLTQTDPGVIVSYDLTGISGHPDHIALGLYLYEFWKKQSKAVLLWPTFIGLSAEKMIKPQLRSLVSAPTFCLTLKKREVFAKWRALKAYKSQALGKGLPLPLFILGLIFRKEYFAQASKTKTYTYQYIEFDLGD